MKPTALILTLLTAALTFPVAAQEAQQEEGPGQAVARISVINGEVSVKRGDSADLVAAAINAPLVVEDRLLTGPSSRAEIQLDYANSIRIGASSEVRLSELDNQRYQIQVALGTTSFRVLRDSNAQVEIATPNVSVRPLGRGTYRISVLEDGSTEITVRSGQADIFTPGGSERLGAGQTMIARGSAQDPEFQMIAAIPMDEWDRYNEGRDRELEHSRSYRYVSPDITGAEDLDQYGRWTNVAPYGDVWVPAADPGWAPYRNGRWVWEDFYGWTWVSYDPWGWAPYHYGRWFWGGNNWCWYPGGIGRQYWSPALVAFFGFGGGGGFGFGVGFGNVGWVPLAPFEPLHRWWGPGRYGRGSVNNITIVNNTNITNIYRNARVTNGITAVNGTDFGRARITNANLVRATSADLGRANLVRGQLPVTPGRESLALSDRAARTTGLPRVADNQRFYSRRQPQPVQRVPFEQQRQSVQALAGQSSANTSGRGTTFGGREAASPAAGASGGWRQAAPAETAPGSSQWHRFGEPAHSGSGAVQARPPAQDGGWRRFGEPGTSRQMQEPAGRGYDRSQPARPETYRPPERQAPPAPRYEAPARPSDRPSRSADSGQRYGGNSYGYTPAPVRISPPIVRERPEPSYQPSRGGGPSYSAPAYSAPRSAPSYSAPRSSAPSYSAPRSAPSYSAPRSSAPSYSAPRSSGGGGGGSRSSAPSGGHDSSSHRGR